MSFLNKNIMIKGLIISFFGIIAILVGKQLMPGENLEKEQAIVYTVKNALDYVHFSPQKLNDEFSAKLFEEYLKNLDGTKRFLTKNDIAQLDVFKTQLDDQILNKNLAFFDLSNKLIVEGVEKTRNFYKELLDKPFNFDSKEVLEMDPDKREWVKDDKELKELWRKIFKYEVLTRVHSDLESQNKIEKKDSLKKSFSEIEKDARSRVLKIYDDMFDRLKKVNRDDRFEMFINTFSNLYDPHTEYFSPKDKEDFDIQMQGKLEGIGARLQTDKEYTKIVEIIPGGPAWKNKELKANDLILKVAQGNSDEYVDLTGMRIDDVVSLIRGKKDTKVKLEVKKPDGSIKIIQLTRDEVIIDETKAKSVILTGESESDQIGFIRLPSFYSEFKSDGNNCADDMKLEIEKLKAKNVKGIVIDLRYNGGGSLPDVVKIAGYFIEKGPIVQVKQTNDKPYVHNDTDSDVIYDGPLVILVNEMSASASEILAAAVQDYNRGVIMGSKATFGKGTVQRFFDLDNMISGSGNIKPLGNIKITTQKFYRINGGSTQLKGVESDIDLPDNYMYMEVGEREYTNAMPWDKIEPVAYNQEVWNVKNKQEIINRSKARMKGDSIFQKVEENARKLKEYSDKTLVSLNLKEFAQDSKKRKEYEDYFKKYIDVEIPSIKVKNLDVDLVDIRLDSSRIARNEEWIKLIKKDYQIKEAMSVIKDMNILK